jgi:hypothetical protein
MTEINPYSYWEQTLFQMIDISHPYKLKEDKEELAAFIKERSSQAIESYTSLILEGQDEHQAKELVRNTILYAGLMFSPTDFLSSFFWHTYQKELDVEERIELYNQSKHIFQKYVSDDFYNNPENENNLEEELTQFFQK